MKPEVECGLTASFLRSGRVLSNFSHFVALIAAGAILQNHTRLWFAGSFLCWPIACYFSVRVAIDESLFRELAASPVDAARALDEVLSRAPGQRTVSDRSRGALRLWKFLISAVVLQFLLLAVALLSL